MNIIKKIFTLMIVSFPILSVYNTGIATLTFADIFLLGLFPFFLFLFGMSNKRVKISWILLLITLLIFFQMLIYLLLGKIDSSEVLTTLRIVLYYFTLSFFCNEFFNLKFGIRCYKVTTIIASLLYIIQFIFLKIFNVFIPGTIPGFSTAVDEYNIIMTTHSWTSDAYARPRSLFSEPSHFAIYVSLCLAILLLQDETKNWKIISIITIAMLLSGSGMAIILCFIIYLFYIISNLKKITIKKIVYTIICILISLPLFGAYITTDSFEIFFNRTFIEKDSTEGRFGNFIDSFHFDKNVDEVMFGEGMYKIADVEGQKYITSIPRVYTYFGLLGFSIFTIIVLYLFKNLKGLNWISWTILFFISFAGEILFHNLFFVFAPYIIKEEKDE